MGRKYFWIGGYDYVGAPPWLVAPQDGATPYFCCRCPCVEYYAVFAFRAILLTGSNHDTYDYCSQMSGWLPLGVQEGTHYIMMDRVLSLSITGQTMTINPNTAAMEECGRGVYEYAMGPSTAQWWEIRAYRISDKYLCYDEFREACFANCTNLPCDETDPITHECIHHYLPDNIFVFDGSKRPYYGVMSSAWGTYGCYSYWSTLASSHYVPRFSITWQGLQVSASITRDQYQGNNLYAASLSLNGSTSYYTLIWDGQGDAPDRTTSANVGWLSSALSAATPSIEAARDSATSTWPTLGSAYTETDRLCSDWQASSHEYCPNSSTRNSKQWYWGSAKFVLAKPSGTASEVTGVTLRIVARKRHYTGAESSSSSMAGMPEPEYVETTTVEMRDCYWNETQYLAKADGLDFSTGVEACNPDYDHSSACFTPCSSPSGLSLPYDLLNFEIQAVEYLYGNLSSSSGSV